ncbi:MAG TPA: GxxExxY protein [Pyrinomonadaceae bacterium]|nr:GxxExxY protein [Pyrinomonadaceae bacterium]HNU06273.1 GxxExxY protein [Pyrinomonadaceae bacterium]
MEKLILRQEVYDVVGAAIEVHTVLGHGFLEPVYQEAMQFELTSRVIPWIAQQELSLHYKDNKLSKTYVPDFVCFEQIIVEIKALSCLTSREVGQLINYLRITGLRVGLLINFGSVGRLEWQRFVI